MNPEGENSGAKGQQGSVRNVSGSRGTSFEVERGKQKVEGYSKQAASILQ